MKARIVKPEETATVVHVVFYVVRVILKGSKQLVLPRIVYRVSAILLAKASCII